MCMHMHAHVTEFLISIGQICSIMVSVCVPLGIHLEPINKELMLLVTI